MNQFLRSEMIFGEVSMLKISRAKIAVFGIGGVGGAVVEALVRGGVGAIDLIDEDTVSLSNLNRQVIALHSTIGRDKVDVMKDRLLDINPDLSIKTFKLFYLPENADEVDLSVYDYIVDAVDTMKAKLELVTRAWQLGVPIISAMGAGNKLDISKLTLTDIYKTSACPLARVMRCELRRRGIPQLQVVYSTEVPIKPFRLEREVQPVGSTLSGNNTPTSELRRAIPGSSSFVPPAMGLIIAGEILREIGCNDKAQSFCNLRSV